MTSAEPYIPGQRWLSTMEPELGLGLIREADRRQVAVWFPAAQTERRYSQSAAPLKRVRFQEGDAIETQSGDTLTVKTVQEDAGLITYHCDGDDVPESELAGTQAAESPLPRLLAGHVDTPRAFDLRLETLRRRHDLLKSPARGFAGCRISLIPHQLDVAYETATRPLPRVLLADEVGLGKTIEAGLILHRQLLTGRASRVLIVVPEALTVQWFIELYRRFHLSFTLVGDHPLKDHDAAEVESDPFEPSLCLAGLEGLLSHERWVGEAMEAQWDLVIFDEAHHLDELPGAHSLAEALAAQTPGLLLLTATPESIGPKAHFERLRLLDPHRYSNFDDFMAQQSAFKPVADLAARLLDEAPVTPADESLLTSMGIDAAQDRGDVVRALVDRHGEGRAVFRNTRNHVAGFPERKVHLHPLEGDSDAMAQMAREVTADLAGDSGHPHYANDPRLLWLINWLKSQAGEKALLISRTPEKAEALLTALKKKMPVKAALFHERLTLLQRDRQAAWFAEPEGARLLIASEIGGEGRNFQFAHHLIFFDLPADPEKVEQRIGRLDRIGQHETVHIHVPYLRASGQAMTARWLHDGLNAFGAAVAGGHNLYLEFQKPLEALLKKPNTEALTQLIDTTRERAHAVAQQVHEGRDRLLELNAVRPERAEALREAMAAADEDSGFYKWTRRLFNHFGIKADAHTPETWSLDFDLLNQPALPLPRLHEEGLIATFDRDMAQEREDWLFLSSEHPLIDAACTLLLESDTGGAAFAELNEPGWQGLLTETVFVLECVAPTRLFADRFLPPAPLRIVLATDGNLCTEDYPANRLKALRPARQPQLLENAGIRQKLRELIALCQDQAEAMAEQVRKEALETMRSALDVEIHRLMALAKLNPCVRREEIEAMLKEKAALEAALTEARIRLDSLRVIIPTA